jgi:sulfur-carrier protein
VAEIHLPTPLLALFPELPRSLEIEAATVGEAIATMDERWPGLRDRLVQAGPALRPHIIVYVDKERAGLDTDLLPASRVDVIAAISGGWKRRNPIHGIRGGG